MPKLGSIIRALREENGISRNALARAAKIDPSILTRLEQGQRDTVHIATLCHIAEALDVSLDDLASAAGLMRKRYKAAAASRAPSVALREALERIEEVASAALEPNRRRR